MRMLRGLGWQNKMADDKPSQTQTSASSVTSSILWDPLTSSDWDKEKHTREAILRIKGDLETIYKEPPPGICVFPEQDNISVIHILITGPFDTPYEGGLFHFLLKFPPNYPFSPPRVRLLTTGGGTVRFNPNLYQNGKVCLSILGTWSGPGWTATQSLLSVLVSIQSLMSEKPYHNEPGYRKPQNPGDVERYNEVIIHETLRVAVCEAVSKREGPPELQEVRREMFLGFTDYYVSTANELATRLDGQPMKDPFHFNKGTFNFTVLSSRILSLQQTLQPPTLSPH